MMKAISGFLLVLIIIGLVAFATQKIWVPKLVASIIASESVPPVLVEPAQPNVAFKDGRQCYTYSHAATADEPYAVTDFVTIDIAGDKVTGKKTGTQNGPGVSNGYEGSLVGTLDKNTITAVLSYVVEGSQGKEKEMYRKSKTGIEKLHYPLVEEGGMLVPDTTKEFKTLVYTEAACKDSN